MRIEEFKAALGKFPTGVAVVTTNSNGRLFGFTSNSFTSVSLEPLLISFCLAKKAGSFNAFLTNKRFGISVLSIDQANISKQFASKIPDKFLGIDYYVGPIYAVPLINGSICTLECQKYDQIECGDHYIFVGEVKSTIIDETKSPLIYFAKSYNKL